MARGKPPTNYKRLRNRCARCGHRLEMKASMSANRCQVEAGFDLGSKDERIVRCRVVSIADRS